MTLLRFKNIKLQSYKPGKSLLAGNKNIIKLSANESALGVSKNVEKIVKSKFDISKILNPLNLSGLASLETPSRPQSSRLLVCSTDIMRMSPTIDTSPCPPGHTTDDIRLGIPSVCIS